MQSPYTRYVTAGLVLLASLSLVFPGGSGNIAIAEVQKAVEEMQTARVTGTRTVFLGDDTEPVHRLTVEKLFWIYHGYVDRTFDEEGRLLIEFAYHVPTGTATVLFPQARCYYRLQIPESRRDELKAITPEGLFEALFASGDYRKLEPREVQGIKAVGFEVTDLTERVFGRLGGSQKIADLFFAVRSMSARMWVDPKARLPILVEAEGEVGPCLINGYQKMRLTEIDDRWQFGVEFDETQFKPEIPEGYQTLSVPAGVKAGAVLSGISLASVPVFFIRARRSRRRRG